MQPSESVKKPGRRRERRGRQRVLKDSAMVTKRSSTPYTIQTMSSGEDCFIDSVLKPSKAFLSQSSSSSSSSRFANELKRMAALRSTSSNEQLSNFQGLKKQSSRFGLMSKKKSSGSSSDINRSKTEKSANRERKRSHVARRKIRRKKSNNVSGLYDSQYEPPKPKQAREKRRHKDPRKQKLIAFPAVDSSMGLDNVNKSQIITIYNETAAAKQTERIGLPTPMEKRKSLVPVSALECIDELSISQKTMCQKMWERMAISGSSRKLRTLSNT